MDPLTLAILGGMASGVGGTLLGGLMSKKSDTITTTTTYGAQNIHQPYETYAPQVQYSPSTSYAYTGSSYIINSAGASISKKAEATSTASPSQTGAWDIPTSQPTSTGVGVGTGIDWTMIAIVAAVGLVGYGVFTGGK
jgi:hypothetical protein